LVFVNSLLRAWPPLYFFICISLCIASIFVVYSSLCINSKGPLCLTDSDFPLLWSCNLLSKLLV